MIIYIAGPYSNGDVAQNVHNAIAYAETIIEKGHTPYIPHLTHFWHLIFPRPYKFWLDYDSQFLPKCDCVYRIAGRSEGADKEVNQAMDLGMPVYFRMEDIPDERNPQR